MTETRSSNQNYVKDLPVRLRDRTLLFLPKCQTLQKNHLHNAHQKLDYYGLDFQKVQNIAFRIVKYKPCPCFKSTKRNGFNSQTICFFFMLGKAKLSWDQKRIISELGSF